MALTLSRQGLPNHHHMGKYDLATYLMDLPQIVIDRILDKEGENEDA